MFSELSILNSIAVARAAQVAQDATYRLIAELHRKQDEQHQREEAERKKIAGYELRDGYIWGYGKPV